MSHSRSVIPVLAAYIMLAEGSPAAAPVEIGQWLTVLAFLLGIVYIVLNIYFKVFPHKHSAEQFVTKEQMEASIATLAGNIATVVADFATMKSEFHSDLKAVRSEMESVKTTVNGLSTTFGFLSEKLNDIKVSHKELRDYTSVNTHEQKNALNAMGLKMERMVVAVEMLMKHKEEKPDE